MRLLLSGLEDADNACHHLAASTRSLTPSLLRWSEPEQLLSQVCAWAAQMCVTSNGQVTFHQAIRERCGLLPHTEVHFVEEGGRVFLEKHNSQPSRGEIEVGDQL